MLFIYRDNFLQDVGVAEDAELRESSPKIHEANGANNILYCYINIYSYTVI